MHSAKVESPIELIKGEGTPPRTAPSRATDGRSGAGYAERSSQSGIHPKAPVPWLHGEKEGYKGLTVVSAEQSRRLEQEQTDVSPEGACRLVVVERGAQWPQWLAQALSGGATTYLVAEAVGDGLGGLVARVQKRALQCEMPISQLIWLSAQSKRLAPLRWIRRLSSRVSPGETWVIVPATTSIEAVRSGVRRQTRNSVWPRAVVA
jgi:hypothetical protein